MVNIFLSFMLGFTGLFLIWAVKTAGLGSLFNICALFVVTAIIMALGWNFLVHSQTGILVVLLALSLILQIAGWIFFVNHSPSLGYYTSEKPPVHEKK